MNHQNHFSFPFLVLILCLMGIVICPLTLYSTGPQLAQVAIDNANQPQSPTDLIMMSRSTAPTSVDQGMGITGWFAIILVLAITTGLLYVISLALRQWRLVKKVRRPATGFSPVPTRPLYDIPQLPAAKPAPRVPVLPDGFNFEESNHVSHH